MSYLSQFPVWKTTFGEKGVTIFGARSLEKNTSGSNQTGSWLYESINQAKVFKARAVPQALCGNLIDALKLLANQQENGDGLIQNI